MLEKDRDGRTEVHHCAFRNDASSLQALVAAGAAPSEPDRAGLTPLHFAAQENAVDAARMLLALGANADVRKYFP